MTIATRLATGYHWLSQMVATVADFDQVLKSQTTAKTRAEMERIVMASLAAELIGASLAPPDLALRLMPHFVPHVYQWRRATGGLKDFTGEANMGC